MAYGDYVPSVRTELVRAVVVAHRVAAQTNYRPPFEKSMVALMQDLQRVDREEAKIRADKEAEEARRHPALTVQKVVGIVRRAKVQISSADYRIGRGDGIVVEYGSYFDRDWVKVSFNFNSSFAFNHGVRRNSPDETKLMRSMLAKHLFGTAKDALTAAGLNVTTITDNNPFLAHLVVTP